MSSFKLTNDTYKLFIYRFNKLMKKTGVLVVNSTYSGKKSQYNQLKKIGFKDFKLPVVKTAPMYIHKDKISSEFRTGTYKGKMFITMNMTGGSFFYIDFNTRIYTDSEKIMFKTGSSHSLPAHVTTITSFHSPKEALDSISRDEIYEKEYWKDHESSLDEIIDYNSIGEIL